MQLVYSTVDLSGQGHINAHQHATGTWNLEVRFTIADRPLPGQVACPGGLSTWSQFQAGLRRPRLDLAHHPGVMTCPALLPSSQRLQR